ncbi:MAG: hypothetical protein AB7G23_21005 [Vicinamibacterales bacterium]
MADFVHGRFAKLKIRDANDTMVDISDYLLSVSLPRSIEASETTTFGHNFKTYIPGMGDATMSCEFRWAPFIEELLSGLIQRVTDFEYYPNGEASGKVKYTGDCVMTSFPDESNVSDVKGGSAEFQVSDSVVRTVLP